jgi:hypothetical protein
MTTRFDVVCDGVTIGSYPTRDDAAAHAQKHARNTYGAELAGWKKTGAGELAKTAGDPPVRYTLIESSSPS